MEKYAVIQQVNGAFTVKFEGADLNSLKVNYHQWVAALWNDAGAVEAVVKIVDGNLDTVDGYVEFISHGEKA